MHEIIKAVSFELAILLTLFVSYYHLEKKQYQEAWWFLALAAIVMFNYS